MKTIKRKLCAILCAAVLVGVLTPTASAATFSDVYNHWAASYIETCAGRGIVDGVSGGKFEPEGKVTNAQFVKMLCTAFFDQEQQTHEVSNRAAMDAYFGGNTPWYGYRSYYFSTQGLLNSVDYNIQSATSANQPMNRNNMAQVAANVLAQKGIAANEGDKALAQAKLTYVNDYYNIPENNRDAVKTCYALGIITGTDGGKFDGGNTMTRAQACTVITRLLDVVRKTPDPDPIVTPTPDLSSGPKDIQVTTTTTTDSKGVIGTAHNITDNGFPTGYLNNGKEINEANIAELLDKAKIIWTHGMTWTSPGTTNNNWYINLGTVAKSIPNLHGNGENYECSGFAVMLSDYLFGKNNNPWTEVTSFSNIHPGDIIIQYETNGTARHVMTVTSINQTGNRAGYAFCVDGNRGNVVSWASTTNAWNAWGPAELAAYGSYRIFSRWPQ